MNGAVILHNSPPQVLHIKVVLSYFVDTLFFYCELTSDNLGKVLDDLTGSNRVFLRP